MYLARSTPKDKTPHFVIIVKTRLESASKAALSYIWWKTVGIKNLPILYIVKIEVYDLNWSGWIQGKRTAEVLSKAQLFSMKPKSTAHQQRWDRSRDYYYYYYYFFPKGSYSVTIWKTNFLAFVRRFWILCTPCTKATGVWAAECLGQEVSEDGKMMLVHVSPSTKAVLGLTLEDAWISFVYYIFILLCSTAPSQPGLLRQTGMDW